MSHVVYRINAADEIVTVNDAWIRFARENEGEAYLPENVLDRKIWGFIKDDLTVQLYRQIFRRVREGRTLQFTFRCDAPETRRLLEMTVRPLEDGGLQLETIPLWTQHRPYQALLLNSPTAQPERFLLMCGWCKRINIGGDVWEEVEAAAVSLGLFGRQEAMQVTHGICPTCYDAMFEAIKEKKD